MSKKLLIVQTLSSKLSDSFVFSTSFETIYKNVGLDISEFIHLIYLDENNVLGDVSFLAKQIESSNENVVLKDSIGSWAKDINDAIDFAQGEFEYIAIFHDDVFIRCDSWFNIIEKNVKNIDNVGVITSTCTTYKKTRSPITPCRDGFYKDVLDGAWNKGVAFQFHNLPDNWGREKIYSEWTESEEALLDYPSGPVKIFSSWSAVMVLKTENASNISKIEDWTPWTLLNELDYNIEAMKSGYYNCWIPEFLTEHHRSNYINPSTRSAAMIREYRDIAHSSFLKKWGFCHDPARENIESVKKELSGSIMSEFVDTFNSYDWRYFNV